MSGRFNVGRLRGRRRTRGMAYTAAAVALAGALAACGGGSGGGPGSGSGAASSGASGLVTGTFGNSSNFIDDFNEFSPNAQDPTWGMIYEPLMFFDTVQAGNVQPWLATGYTWGPGGKSITFKLRSGVKWTDGKPFTSADVAYTFNLIKSTTALNQYGLPIAGATTSGPDAVTITFTKSVYTDLYYIAGKIEIVPQHIWSKIKDPATWTDPNPVGTGGYELAKITPQVLEITANPHYYMPGLPKVKTYEFLTYSSNTTASSAIEQGQLGWASDFIPNIQKAYLAKNPKFGLTTIPTAVNFLIPNMEKGPTTSLAVRQAISDAIDRSYISQSVYEGYSPVADPAGLLLPDYQDVAAPIANTKFGGADPAKSKQILQAAGFKLPVTVNVQVIAAYSDYISILQIMQPELKAAGINLQITSESPSVFGSNQDTGNFQLIISNAGNTPEPYAFYYNLLDSAVTAPLGASESIGNYGRYKNAQVDKDLATIGGTASAAVQKPAFAQIESVVASQLPVIPLDDGEDEIQWDGAMVTGWPTASNPYAGPPIWLSPDDGWVADRLVPVPK